MNGAGNPLISHKTPKGKGSITVGLPHFRENNKEDMNCENPWERVSKLVELNAETKHDLTRMKQVMIRMKNDAAKN